MKINSEEEYNEATTKLEELCKAVEEYESIHYPIDISDKEVEKIAKEEGWRFVSDNIKLPKDPKPISMHTRKPKPVTLKDNQILCAAFPGTGKSYYCYNGNWSHYIPDGFCCDSDSSQFNKEHFPQNYIEHIKDRIDRGFARIFISSHKEVREALVKNGLEFTLVYPDKSLKEEYLERYKERGSPEQFVTLIEKNWDNWIDECISQKDCKHIVLKANQFISNVM